MHKNNYSSKSDAELLAILQEDEGAFNEIYHRYHKLVYFIAYELCHNDADAKDVMQETFIKVKKVSQNIRDKQKFKYWLNAVTVSKCKDLFKRNKYGNIDHEHPYVKNNQIETRRYMLPEKLMHFNSDKKMLYTFIERLPQNQKEVLLLQYFSDYSLQEIAELLNISEGTVKSRIHYAKDSLRGMIETYNLKTKNKPLNFESIEALLPTAFIYGFQTCKMPIFKMIVKKGMSTIGVGVSTAGIIAGGIFIISASMAGNETNRHTINQQPKFAHPQSQKDSVSVYKEAYFKLMDFAATESDMQAKTKEELEEIKEYYDTLRQTEDNEYWKLLQKNQWVSMYEMQLKK